MPKHYATPANIQCDNQLPTQPQNTIKYRKGT
jgi:hypothetical protein